MLTFEIKELKVAIPAGTTCSGTVGNLQNVCLLKVANPSGAGPFGGVIAFQMANGSSNSNGNNGNSNSNSNSGNTSGATGSGTNNNNNGGQGSIDDDDNNDNEDSNN